MVPAESIMKLDANPLFSTRFLNTASAAGLRHIFPVSKPSNQIQNNAHTNSKKNQFHSFQFLGFVQGISLNLLSDHLLDKGEKKGRGLKDN